jgi:hypothetical protein
MSTEDYRVAMTGEEFSQISNDADDPFYEYYIKFYAENERITRLSSHELREKLPKGLQLLVFVTIFDGQVCNGGISQFFWNCPDLIADVCDVFVDLDQNELRREYETACETLLGKKENWIKLREEAYRDETNPDWSSFAKTYDLLDLSWFDEKYWETYDRDSPGLKVTKLGMRTHLLKAMADYVQTHRDDYIVSTG